MSFTHSLLRCVWLGTTSDFLVINSVYKDKHRHFNSCPAYHLKVTITNVYIINGNGRTGIDNVGNILCLRSSLMRQDNPLEVSWRVINAKNTEPHGDYWTMHGSLENAIGTGDDASSTVISKLRHRIQHCVHANWQLTLSIWSAAICSEGTWSIVTQCEWPEKPWNEYICYNQEYVYWLVSIIRCQCIYSRSEEKVQLLHTHSQSKWWY